jgi:predicted TIM-barrel fold metal-dependent hydrolase
MPIANHGTGKFGNAGRSDQLFTYPRKPGADVHVTEPLHYFFRFTNDAMLGCIQMAFAGVWDRFPTLEVYWAETMVGWFEYGLWQIDDHYERYMPMINENWGLHLLERKPSEYLRERNYWGTLHDPVGIQRREVLGADKILWASDFAHAASDWPHSREIVEQDFAAVPPQEKHMMLAGNAVRFFHLDE